MNTETLIRKYALQNALRHGKAQPGAIVGKVLGENKALVSKKDELIPKINSIVASVNELNAEEIEKELNGLAPELMEKKEKREGLKDLPEAEDCDVVMRFEPSPSGPLHIGHSYVVSLNYEYVKMYNGKLIVRVSDTNPTNIDPDSYDLLKENAYWLTDGHVDMFYIQSDRMEIYYDFALKMIDDGTIYVCTCDSEEFRAMMKEKVKCPCRALEKEVHAKRWRKMFTEYKEGDCVVRFKSDVKHKNPAMRDFPLLRICEEEHPRQGKKYRVWPLMNFSVAIDDMDTGVTHTLRGKDHADNAKRQALIHHALGHKTPIAISVGRINFEGFPVSCSKTRVKIEAGEFTGWDDIRIPFIPALKRRGYLAAALRKYAIGVGVTKTDKSVEINEFFKTINAFNGDLIDSKTDRYSFVKNPVKVIIKNAPDLSVELDLHPEHKKGGREFNTSSEFYLDETDHANIMKSPEGRIFRLMDVFNFTRNGSELVYHSTKIDKSLEAQIIHWVVADTMQEIAVLMDDGSTITGLGEKYISDINDGQIVQFERFGFVRCDDSKTDRTLFWWLHK